ncbi:MAG: GIY-YIG nuclease family protein [Candidatus Paceibacterota bacterium]
MKLYIYIITHPKFEDWIKLGRTVNLKNRLDSYNTGCPLRKYKYSYTKQLTPEQVYSIEYHFKINIYNNGFEWFKCSVQEAILLIEKIINENIVYKNATEKNKELSKAKTKKKKENTI